MKNIDVDRIRFENSVVHINYTDGEEHLWVYNRSNDNDIIKNEKTNVKFNIYAVDETVWIFTY